MNLSIALPILIPLFAGALSLVFWRSYMAQRWIGVIGTAMLLWAGIVLLHTTWQEGIQVMHMGNWPGPFGIVLVADLLGAIMVVLAGITGFATALYSLVAIPREHEKFGYYPLLHLLLAGVSGAFLTGDIFNLYVWFEVMLVASFALIILGGERAQMEGAIKYVTLNLFSSALFLTAVGLLYGVVGSLNMADVAAKLGQIEGEQQGLISVISILFLVGFSIKAAAFPLFFWLPASYHTPQVAVSAIFAALLTKVGVYVLFRFFTLIFAHDTGLTHTILLWVAIFTMLTGALGALAQSEFRRVLSFLIIGSIGYMLLGLSLMTPLAIIGGVIYLIHNIILKANLFLVSGLVYRLQGSYELKKLGGLYRSHPWLALLFLIPALSLAGIPPLSGFVAKFTIIRAGIEAEAWIAVGVALLVGLLTLYSMIKIWNEVFWKAPPEGGYCEAPAYTHQGNSLVMYYLPIAMLASMTVLIGFAAQPIYELAEASAAQLLNPAAYIEAVLGVIP